MVDVSLRVVPPNRCVYVDGYFVVEGEASFVRCENSGGGESPPGPGGVMYVGPTGSVLFADTVYMAEVSIIDNEGNNGAGIYNEGKVIKLESLKCVRVKVDGCGPGPEVPVNLALVDFSAARGMSRMTGRWRGGAGRLDAKSRFDERAGWWFCLAVEIFFVLGVDDN